MFTWCEREGQEGLRRAAEPRLAARSEQSVALPGAPPSGDGQRCCRLWCGSERRGGNLLVLTEPWCIPWILHTKRKLVPLQLCNSFHLMTLTLITFYQFLIVVLFLFFFALAVWHWPELSQLPQFKQMILDLPLGPMSEVITGFHSWKDVQMPINSCELTAIGETAHAVCSGQSVLAAGSRHSDQ